MEIIHLEKNNFKELVSSENKILVDFYATWCGPCKMLGPVLENHQSNIKVIKVDTDEYEDLAREYGVMSIPTLVLIEQGKEVKRSVGFIDDDGLANFLK